MGRCSYRSFERAFVDALVRGNIPLPIVRGMDKSARTAVLSQCSRVFRASRIVILGTVRSLWWRYPARCQTSPIYVP